MSSFEQSRAELRMSRHPSPLCGLNRGVPGQHDLVLVDDNGPGWPHLAHRVGNHPDVAVGMLACIGGIWREVLYLSGRFPALFRCDLV